MRYAHLCSVFNAPYWHRCIVKIAHALDVMTGILRSKKIKIMQIYIAIPEHIGWMHNIFAYRLQRKGV